MSIFAIDGWEIELSHDSPKGSIKETGEKGEAFDGSALETRQVIKTQWSGAVPFVLQAKANAIKGLLLGRGHLWKFDSNIYSSKGLPATFTSPGAARYVDGKFHATNSADHGLTLEETSTEVLTITAGILNQNRSTWSIYFLFNPTAAQDTPANIGYLWECYIDANNYYALKVADTGKIYAEIKSGGVTYTASSASMPAMSIGTYYYICLTADGFHLTLYSDGAAIVTGVDYVEPIGTLPINQYVGCNHSSVDHANGTFDQLMILPYAMHSDQIAALYALAIAPSAIPKLNISGDLTGYLVSNPLQCFGEITGFTPKNYLSGRGETIDFNITPIQGEIL